MTPTLHGLRAAFLAGQLPKPAYIAAMHARHQLLHEYAAFLPSSGVAAIEITHRGVVAVLRDGLRFLCDVRDQRIAPVEILNFGSHEAAELEVATSLLGPNGTAFDVGANVGWWAISLATRRPGAHVLAFEPLATTFAHLRANLALNGVPERVVHAVHVGLDNEDGEAVLYFRPEGSGNASFVDLAGGSERVACTVRRLDTVVAEGERLPYLTRGLDLVKIDVEGAEARVLLGGLETIRRHRPAIMAELLRKWTARFGYHPNDVIAFLAEEGYRCFVVVSSGAAAARAPAASDPLQGRSDAERLREVLVVDDATVETNFFFLHRERHAHDIERLQRAP